MTPRKTVLVSLFLSAAVWAFFTWPLPRYVAEGIPSSSTNIEKGSVRRMIVGDHLQMIYNYWIFSDMLSGKTRFYHNLYEFNTGDDDARKYVGMDLLPFSLVFTLGYWVGGRALGWNLMGFVSVWLTYLLTWLLLRRYTRQDLVAACAALVAVALPYRWATQLGGSPTGYTMVLVPLLFWGLDAAVREGRPAGGLVAGLAVLVAAWNDAHIFFFGVLVSPAWCLLALLHRDDFSWRDLRAWRRIVVGLLPFAVLVGILAVTALVGGAKAEQTSSFGQRQPGEIGIFSPNPSGLVRWRTRGLDNCIYLGWLAPIVVVAGLAAQGFACRRDPRTRLRQAVILSLLVLGFGVLIVLALGYAGPAHGKLMTLVRRCIPPYAAIRQPAKIYCLAPTLLALTLALAARPLAATAARRALLVLLSVLFVAEYKFQVRPTICLLDDEQSAYAAVAADARKANPADPKPRALILPIWPGDSAWASLYEHYVSLYRVRMVNGYHPVIDDNYYKNVFSVLDILNAGVMTDAALAKLREMKVEYVLLHEDAFPEQVSPFPVAFTLKNLFNDPHLESLDHGENVWAFKIREAPGPESRNSRPPFCWPPPCFPDVFFPSACAYAEVDWFADTNRVSKGVEGAGGGKSIVLQPEYPAVTAPVFYHCNATNLGMFVRLRGDGRLTVETAYDNGVTNRHDLATSGTNWAWTRVPVPAPAGTMTVQPSFRLQEGAPELDAMLYAAGDVPDLAPGKDWWLPAPLFFHAGYSDVAVWVRAAYQPDDVIFYGPNLPFAAGSYEVLFHYSSDARAGVYLGSLVVRVGDTATEPVLVLAGLDAKASFDVPPGAMPVRIEFRYSREADMRITGVIFLRVR